MMDNASNLPTLRSPSFRIVYAELYQGHRTGAQTLPQTPRKPRPWDENSSRAHRLQQRYTVLPS